MKRFFVSTALGGDFVLVGQEHNHLANVARCQLSELVVCINGDLFDYTYRIEKISRSGTNLGFISKTKNSCNPTERSTVFQSVIKPDNMAWVVEKLNELGVIDFIPFTSRNSNHNVNIEKLQLIANQSCKQCGRSVPIKVHPTLTFDEVVRNLLNYDSVYLADINGGKIKDVGKNPAIIVGPEGGLTDDEKEQLNITRVSLGPRILRAETAAIAMTVMIMLC